MKLCLSNIGFPLGDPTSVYRMMQGLVIGGLEIAPTIFIGEDPYRSIALAKGKSAEMLSVYGIQVVSMQSIWYGKKEALFGSEEERASLFDYTKQAIDFAAAIGCGVLVFGSPKNRVMPDNGNLSTVVSFFSEIGNYAFERGTALAIEANPSVYGTNFLTSTKEALAFCELVNSPGIGINLDTGTIIQNGESLVFSEKELSLFRHVHISEPFLVPLEQRLLHRDLKRMLEQYGYDGYISLEMARPKTVEAYFDSVAYFAEVFS